MIGHFVSNRGKDVVFDIKWDWEKHKFPSTNYFFFLKKPFLCKFAEEKNFRQ